MFFKIVASESEYYRISTNICTYIYLNSVLTDRPPPIILQGPVNQTLAVDGTALLKCKATGDPMPVISWLKEGFTFLGRDPRTFIQDQGTLQIKPLRVSICCNNIFTFLKSRE